jgi:hypothetical protein
MSNLTANSVLEMLRKLPPQERLKVIARALPELERDLSDQKRPRRSLLGLLEGFGKAPSTEEIDQARREVWKNFPREDL